MTKPKTKNNARAAKPTVKPSAEANTKKDRVLALLRREGGARLDEVVEATGWLPHTARAVFTGMRKKGFTLVRTRTDGVTKYAVAAEPAA